MNLFALFANKDGSRELVRDGCLPQQRLSILCPFLIQLTPPLDRDVILAGITRRSVIEMCKSWGEFEVKEVKMTMEDIVKANTEGRLMEMFASGTAAVVCPVGGIKYEGKMIKIPTPDNSVAGR